MNQAHNKRSACSSSQIFLGDRAIGGDEPVYIIAEAGVNHNGQFDLALKLVEAAKRSGADAVKFQVFIADELVTGDAPYASYQSGQGFADQRQMLRQLELGRQEFVDLFIYCRDVGIEFLATPFGRGDLAFLVDLGVRAIKLASTDLVNVPLLEGAIDSGLPLILSTGACHLAEIDAAFELFANRAAVSRLALMHCISSYPVGLTDANLCQIVQLQTRYGRPVGFSDHTAECVTGSLAVAAGASLLEKHFTLDRSMSGPDHVFSLDESDLTQYVAEARQAQAAMGVGSREVLACEREVRKVARGSIVAAVDIPAGVMVTPAMLTVKRPGGGIEPNRIGELVGLTAIRDIPADTVLSWHIFQPAGSEAIPAPS